MKKEWFLHTKEHIVHKFEEFKIPLYLTNRRIVFTKYSWGNLTFQDISLNHLTGIEAKKEILWWLIAIGIMITIILPIIRAPSFINFIGIIIGVLFILAGFFGGQKEVAFISDSGKNIRVGVKNQEQIEKIITIVREHEQF